MRQDAVKGAAAHLDLDHLHNRKLVLMYNASASPSCNMHALHAIVVNPDNGRRQATGDVRVVSGLLCCLEVGQKFLQRFSQTIFIIVKPSQSRTPRRFISFLHRLLYSPILANHSGVAKSAFCHTIRYVRRRSCRRNNKVCPPLLYLNYPRS